jgi:uncharacterized membrane protein YraQ (UPF0718 family)
MDFIFSLILTAIGQVGQSLLHNWPYLLVGILIAALLKRYIDAEKVSTLLLRYRNVGVLASTVAAVATPLCSCGTTAVVLGMLASTVPWAPIVAFMVASPLTSPQELLYSAGLFGWPFALAFFLASILLGLVGGAIAGLIENWGWLKNQIRFSDSEPQSDRHQALVWLEPASTPDSAAALQPASLCGCSQPAVLTQPAALTQPADLTQPAVISLPTRGSSVETSALACSCSRPESILISPLELVCCEEVLPASLCACVAAPARNIPIQDQPALGAQYRTIQDVIKRAGVADLLKEIYNSARQLLPIFLGFAFIGYFLNGLIPASWIEALFGGGSIYSVPLAATLGLPLYINTEGSLPLVRALLDHGMSQGAALAFMISGAGTSLGAVAGAFTIARWRVVALVVGILWIGAIFSGYLFNFLLALKLF